MNSGIIPTYEPGQEPRQWKPASETSTEISSDHHLQRHSTRDKSSAGYIENPAAIAEQHQHIKLFKHGTQLCSVLQSSDSRSLFSANSESMASSQIATAKLRREARAEHFRQHGKGPDLSKVHRFPIPAKSNSIYNRLAGCELTLYHPGRDSYRGVSSQIDEKVNLRVALAKDSLKVLAILRLTDAQQPSASRFYNIASLSWSISSRPESFVRCSVDKMKERKITSKGRWQYKPTYFFEVKSQGKLEQGYLDKTLSPGLDIDNCHLEKGFSLIRNIRDLALQSLTEQKNRGVETPSFWFSIHSLSPQTDDDDSLRQVSSPDSKFEFVSWNDAPQKLLEECLGRSLNAIQTTIEENTGPGITSETMNRYQEALKKAEQHGTVGIPILPALMARYSNATEPSPAHRSLQDQSEAPAKLSSSADAPRCYEEMPCSSVNPVSALKQIESVEEDYASNRPSEDESSIAGIPQDDTVESSTVTTFNTTVATPALHCPPDLGAACLSQPDPTIGFVAQRHDTEEIDDLDEFVSEVSNPKHGDDDKLVKSSKAGANDHEAEQSSDSGQSSDEHFKMDMTSAIARRIFAIRQRERNKAHRLRIFSGRESTKALPSAVLHPSHDSLKYRPIGRTPHGDGRDDAEESFPSNSELAKQDKTSGPDLKLVSALDDAVDYFNADIDRAIQQALVPDECEKDSESDTTKTGTIDSSRFSNIFSLTQRFGLSDGNAM
ncbi:hypothetical protein ABW21_db0209051 [Orbilia brochopaga]|nr:hypothetical protein ABW21_db0209051 [Drechslerella brochopaga]